MAELEHVTTITAGPHDVGLVALEIAWISGTPYLLTGSEIDGGLVSYAISTSGLTYTDHDSQGPNSGTAGLSDIDVIDINGQPVLIPSGRADDNTALHVLDPAGAFDGFFLPDDAAGWLSGTEVATTASVLGTTFVITSQWGQPDLHVFSIGSGLGLNLTHSTSTSDTPAASDVTDLETITIGDRAFVFSLSGSDGTITTHWLGHLGDMRLMGVIGPDQGLWVSAPTALATAEVGDLGLLIVGAAGSNSLSVVSVGPYGETTVLSHYLDSRDTRFGGVQAVETFEIGNRSFVIAGGGDDGLSVFEILPGGALYHLDTIADQTDTTLMNLSAIAVAVLDGVAQIFASGSDEGVTQFALDLSDLSDSQIGSDQGDVISGDGGQNLLAGMAGDDTLSAGGGDDRLIDGSGQDTLFGGAGADVFIFVADGEHDMIADFENGTDLIHLGEIPMLYGFDQLTLTPQGDGVQLAFGNETLLIMPDSGTLQVSDLTADDFIFGF